MKKTFSFKSWNTNLGFEFYPCFGCSNLTLQCTCLEGLRAGRQKSIRELCFQCLAMLHRSSYSFSQDIIGIRATLLTQSDLWRFHYLQAVLLSKYKCYWRVLENITAVKNHLWLLWDILGLSASLFWVAVNALQSSVHTSVAAEGMAALRTIMGRNSQDPWQALEMSWEQPGWSIRELTTSASTVRWF